MSEDYERFQSLMKQVQAGSEDAVRELLDKYGDHIYRAVRRRLHRQMRSKFDSQDFVQAVWASFFTKSCLETDFDNSEALVAFLARVAGNKVVTECRKRMGTEKYNVNRERSIDNSTVRESSGVRAMDPTPSEVAIANEQFGNLITGQSPQNQQIFRLRAAGATNNEIALQLRISERTVRRVIRKESHRAGNMTTDQRVSFGLRDTNR